LFINNEPKKEEGQILFINKLACLKFYFFLCFDI
jgi:hypothetical protein